MTEILLYVLLVVLVAGFVAVFAFMKKLNDGRANKEALDKASLTIDFLTEEKKALNDKNAALENENKTLTGQIAALKVSLEKEREHLNDKIAELKRVRDDFTDQFKLISAEILKTQGEDFTKTQKESVLSVVTPLKEQLDVFKQRIEDINRAEAEDKGKMRAQLEQLFSMNQNLAKEAQDLTNALKGNTKYQGDWGETQLERVFEIAGFQKGVHYFMQENVKDEEGHNKRPDYLVKLSEDRVLIIDCKVSLNAYTRFVNATTPQEAQDALNEHVQALKNHIKNLSSKGYQRDIGGTQNYVLMFIPVEHAYIEALRVDPLIYEQAYVNNIAVTTASSLLPLLRTIDNLWRIEKQNKNVAEMAKVGGRLYDKMALFVSDMNNIDTALKKAKDAYDDAFRKLQGKDNALRLADKLKELGAKTSKTIEFERDDDDDVPLIGKD